MSLAISFAFLKLWGPPNLLWLSGRVVLWRWWRWRGGRGSLGSEGYWSGPLPWWESLSVTASHPRLKWRRWLQFNLTVKATLFDSIKLNNVAIPNFVPIIKLLFASKVSIFGKLKTTSGRSVKQLWLMSNFSSLAHPANSSGNLVSLLCEMFSSVRKWYLCYSTQRRHL